MSADTATATILQLMACWSFAATARADPLDLDRLG
jgi:hypothetical protein